MTCLGRCLIKDAYKEEAVESEKVTTSFFQLGETKIELLEGGADSAHCQVLLRKREKAFITSRLK